MWVERSCLRHKEHWDERESLFNHVYVPGQLTTLRNVNYFIMYLIIHQTKKQRCRNVAQSEIRVSSFCCTHQLMKQFIHHESAGNVTIFSPTPGRCGHALIHNFLLFSDILWIILYWIPSRKRNPREEIVDVSQGGRTEELPAHHLTDGIN